MLFEDSFLELQVPSSTASGLIGVTPSNATRSLSADAHIITGALSTTDIETIIPSPPTPDFPYPAMKVKDVQTAFNFLGPDNTGGQQQNVWASYFGENFAPQMVFPTATLTYEFIDPLNLSGQFLILTKSPLIPSTETIADINTHPSVTYDLILYEGAIPGPPIPGVPNSPTDATAIIWDIPPLNDAVLRMDIRISNGDMATSFGIAFSGLAVSLTCVTSETEILMADGTTKQIHEIKRGDIVAGDPECKNTHMVAAVNKLVTLADSKIDLLKFEKGSLGENLPSKQLAITGNHPIIWKNARRPAKCFSKLPDVIHYEETTPASNILPTDLSLYDLQFDHDGTYVANGITVQSRCPRSNLTPLPRHLYFDDNNWTEDLTWDSFDQPLPLSDEQIIDLKN